MTDDSREHSASDQRICLFGSRSGHMHRTALFLEYQIDGVSDSPYDYIDEDEWSPETFVQFAVAKLKRDYRDWYDSDAAPLYWSVVGESIGGETAPFANGHIGSHENFLTHYSWPIDEQTMEPLNVFLLPIRPCVPELEVGLGYKPAALQATIPIRTIVEQWQHTNGQVPWMFDPSAF